MASPRARVRALGGGQPAAKEKGMRAWFSRRSKRILSPQQKRLVDILKVPTGATEGQKQVMDRVRRTIINRAPDAGVSVRRSRIRNCRDYDYLTKIAKDIVEGEKLFAFARAPTVAERGKIAKEKLRKMRKAGAPIGVIPWSDEKAATLLKVMEHNGWKISTAGKVMTPLSLRAPVTEELAQIAEQFTETAAPSVEQTMEEFMTSLQRLQTLRLSEQETSILSVRAGAKAKEYKRLISRERVLRKEIFDIGERMKDVQKQLFNKEAKLIEARETVDKVNQLLARMPENVSEAEKVARVAALPGGQAVLDKYEEAKKLIPSPGTAPSQELSDLKKEIRDLNGRMASVQTELNQHYRDVIRVSERKREVAGS